MSAGKARREFGGILRVTLFYLGCATLGFVIGAAAYWLVGPKIENPESHYFRFMLDE